MIGISVREALADADREACFAIRIEVFCDEQNVSREIEFDGLDDACRHFIALDGERRSERPASAASATASPNSNASRFFGATVGETLGRSCSRPLYAKRRATGIPGR
jgi:predicted GNAT family N-acyltransferase